MRPVDALGVPGSVRSDADEQAVLVPSGGEVRKGCAERFESEVVGEVSAQLGNVARGDANLTDPGDACSISGSSARSRRWMNSNTALSGPGKYTDNEFQCGGPSNRVRPCAASKPT